MEYDIGRLAETVGKFNYSAGSCTNIFFNTDLLFYTSQYLFTIRRKIKRAPS